MRQEFKRVFAVIAVAVCQGIMITVTFGAYALIVLGLEIRDS
jgi:hypothetical protein